MKAQDLFEDWWSEPESFGVRSERCIEECCISDIPSSEIRKEALKELKAWLRAAYTAGYMEAKYE